MPRFISSVACRLTDLTYRPLSFWAKRMKNAKRCSGGSQNARRRISLPHSCWVARFFASLRMTDCVLSSWFAWYVTVLAKTYTKFSAWPDLEANLAAVQPFGAVSFCGVRRTERSRLHCACFECANFFKDPIFYWNCPYLTAEDGTSFLQTSFIRLGNHNRRKSFLNNRRSKWNNYCIRAVFVWVVVLRPRS